MVPQEPWCVAQPGNIHTLKGACGKQQQQHPTEIVNASAGPGKVSCALAGWGFFMVRHFHNFLTFLTLVPINIVIASAGPGKVSCADNGQLGIFVAHFRNFLPQCCAAKNCFLV